MLHPESAVAKPVFYLYKTYDDAGDFQEPDQIQSIKVYLYNTGDSQERIDVRASLSRGAEQMAWSVEYLPASSEQASRPVTSITYGEVPAGYKEKNPALPLMPERLYVAYIRRIGTTYSADPLRFIIRLGQSETPVKLEYGGIRYGPLDEMEIKTIHKE